MRAGGGRFPLLLPPVQAATARLSRTDAQSEHQALKVVALMQRFLLLCVSGMYFFTIVQALVDSGYTRGEDVRGAPYDWRKAPSKQPPSPVWI